MTTPAVTPEVKAETKPATKPAAKAAKKKAAKKKAAKTEKKARVLLQYRAVEVKPEDVTIRPDSDAAVVLSVVKKLKTPTANEVIEHIESKKLIKTKMELSACVRWLLGYLKRGKMLSTRKAA